MIVGVSGPKGSGKDTVADILVREHGFTKIALADPLKRICRDVFGFTVEQLWGSSRHRDALDARYPRQHTFVKGRCACCRLLEQGAPPACFLTPRYALQLLGTEWGRRCYPDIWVERTMEIAGALLHGRKGLGEERLVFAYEPEHGLVVRGSRLPRGVAISDVRFPNEVDAIRARSGLVWRSTHVPDTPADPDDHESESYFDKLVVDHVLPDWPLHQMPNAIQEALAA